MNHLVRIIVDEEGWAIERPVWCAVDNWEGSLRTFCNGEVFGVGEASSETAQHEEKYTDRGGITCKRCKVRIRIIKDIRL